jgi:hypothetical protein
MANKETVPLKLERGYKFEVAPQQWRTYDRLTIFDETGPEEFLISGRTVRLMRPNITGRVVTSYNLEDVEPTEAKQLLVTHEKLLAAAGALTPRVRIER